MGVWGKGTYGKTAFDFSGSPFQKFQFSFLNLRKFLSFKTSRLFLFYEDFRPPKI